MKPENNTEACSSAVASNAGLDARTVKYSREFDAYYKADTGEWLEEKCSDPLCEFCETRPVTANVQIEARPASGASLSNAGLGSAKGEKK